MKSIMLVDSHCHLDQLDLTPFSGQLELVLQAAKDNGVGHFLCAGITLEDLPTILQLAKKYPGISAAVGVHPNEVNCKEPTVEELIQLALDSSVVALGETGLDYYRSEGNLDWQHERFRRHIRAAKQAKKPLIVHSRQAREDTLRILQEENAAEIGGVLHCFTEDMDMAERAIEQNFYISFSGIVTFKNAVTLQHVARNIPLERLLVETDSPYLAPTPMRGKPNYPTYVRYVAEFIATLRGITYQEVAECTTNNYFQLFKSSKRD